MKQAPVDVTNEKLFQEFSTVVAETEQLIKSVAGAGAAKSEALREGLAEGIAAAGERLAKIRVNAVAQANSAARATDEYVQGNPWQAIGIAAGLAAATGLIAGLLIARR